MTRPSQARDGAPFDLEAAAAAAAAEAGARPFVFTYKGAEYTVPPIKSWTVEANELLAAGELEAGLSSVIGKDQYQQLRDAGLTTGELEVLMDQAAKASGLENLPNSSPPRRPGSTRT